jgi:hypothetical protein
LGEGAEEGQARAVVNFELISERWRWC